MLTGQDQPRAEDPILWEDTPRGRGGQPQESGSRFLTSARAWEVIGVLEGLQPIEEKLEALGHFAQDTSSWMRAEEWRGEGR